MVFVEENSLYRRLTRAWYVLAAGGALTLAYYLTSEGTEDSDDRSVFGSCFYGNIAFLLSWGINIGMTMWVSFVAGLVMLKTLDRHNFTLIQSKLFPIYFVIQTVTCLVQLIAFLSAKKNVSVYSTYDITVAVSIGAGLISGIFNGLWFGKSVSKIGFKKIAMEKEEGVIAPNIGSKLGENPAYRALSKQFGMYHGISTLLNLFSFVGSIYIAYFVSLELLKAGKVELHA